MDMMNRRSFFALIAGMVSSFLGNRKSDASTLTATTLVDTSQGWDANQWECGMVKVRVPRVYGQKAGAGGQYYRIAIQSNHRGRWRINRGKEDLPETWYASEGNES